MKMIKLTHAQGEITETYINAERVIAVWYSPYGSVTRIRTSDGQIEDCTDAVDVILSRLMAVE